ncbi:MAG: DUF2079 domain-containing protein [Patescibacteria group bacterium]
MTPKDNNNHSYKKILLVLTAIVFLVVVSGLAIKYQAGGYNGLDLAIYHQTIWNSSQGNLFSLTIHPHSYLGDHIELILLLLVPFYWLWSQPFTLVIIQSIILLAAVWPLWLICRQWLASGWSLIIGVLWLVCPFVHNTNSFEFHALAFAPFFLFWTIYFYLRHKWWPFLLFLVISLTIREDISLIILMFGILAFIDKRSWLWRLLPLILGLLWFIISLKISPLLTGYEQYKFLAYYGWLGPDPGSMILNIFNHPIYVLQNIATLRTLTFAVGLFIPFLFLPFIRPKYLVLIIISVIQLIFVRNPGELSLQIHYTAPLLAPIFVSLAYSLRHLFNQPNSRLTNFLKGVPGLAQTVVITAMIGGLVFISPLLGFAKQLLVNGDHEAIQLRKDIIAQISPNDKIATGYYLLTSLSGRSSVYSLHYQFLGTRQFSDITYDIPNDVDTAIVNSDDALIYHVTYEETYEENLSGDDRLRQFLDPAERGLVTYLDKYAIYKKGELSKFDIYQLPDSLPDDFNRQTLSLDENTSMLGWAGDNRSLSTTEETINDNTYRLLPITLYWQTSKTPERDYNIRLVLKRDDQIIRQERYALALGLYPTTNWQPGEIVATNYRFLLPDSLGDLNGVTVEIVGELLDGHLWLDNWWGVAPTYDSIKTLDSTVLGQL